MFLKCTGGSPSVLLTDVPIFLFQSRCSAQGLRPLSIIQGRPVAEGPGRTFSPVAGTPSISPLSQRCSSTILSPHPHQLSTSPGDNSTTCELSKVTPCPRPVLTEAFDYFFDHVPLLGVTINAFPPSLKFSMKTQ